MKIIDLRTGREYLVDMTVPTKMTKTLISVIVRQKYTGKPIVWRFNRQTHLDTTTKSYALIGEGF